jgi:iron-sulfur cluster repair protein YtfE (RIC family)
VAEVQTEPLAEALEREHREIDAGIAAFTGDASPAVRDRQALSRAIGALRRHIYVEEEFLFPLLYRADNALVALLSVMLREHAQLWATLDALEREPDAGAALALCTRLTSQLLHHNLKEEKVVYPRADDLLPQAASAHLRAVLSSAEPTAGWVCARALPAARHPDG